MSDWGKFTGLLTITMHEYRITKYDPNNRNHQGHYLDLEEWTEFSDVGKSVSLQEYMVVEAAYISSALDLVSDCEPAGLRIKSLEDYQNKCCHKENEVVALEEIEAVLRSVLRGDYWCMLESDQAFIHIGYDFYMYIGLSSVSEKVITRTIGRGLYVEKFISPYHPEDC